MKHVTCKLKQQALTRKMFQVSGFRFQEAGFSLFEILIAIAVFAVVGVATAQLISVALQSDKVGGEKTVAVGLEREEVAAVNAIAAEQWNNLYLLNKGSTNHYHAVVSSGKWATSTGDALVTANNLQYTKYFYIENVSRTGGAIDTTYNPSNDDPSTQKATVVVTWQDSGGGALGTTTQSAFITRSRNAAAVQTGWDDSGGGTAPTSGENGAFGTGVTSLDAANVSTTTPAGSITLKQQ